MSTSTAWSLPFSIGVYLFASALILVCGVLKIRVAARLAALTALDETLIGALLLAAGSPPAQIATSLTAASREA